MNMRQRIFCEFKRKFGEIFNPCRKVLCDIIADKVTRKGAEIIVTRLKQVIIKCPKCKHSTIIKTKEDRTDV